MLECTDGSLTCGAIEGAPTAEECNGVDDDCDGPVDEDDVCAIFASCQDALASGESTDGVYGIADLVGQQRDVWCDQSTDDGGWTLVASSRNGMFDDQRSDWHAQLTTLAPASPTAGVWDGLRGLGQRFDVRFTCRAAAAGADAPMDVDLSFYDVPWYWEMTTGTDAQSCLSEGNGAGADPPPARRNNLNDDTRPAGDPWNDKGYLEMEDSCGDVNDFTIDFDDKGIDGASERDGTDWGEDDIQLKCATARARELDGQWFIFVRERP